MQKKMRVMILLAACSMAGCQTPDQGGESSAATNDHQRGAGRHGRPRDIDGYIARMESPERAAWQKRDQVLAALKLKPGERVADVGCGPGYFTIPIAEAVGPSGKVWAVDIEPKMLQRLREHADEANLDNIEFVLAPEDDPSLPRGKIDTILIVDTYHHFPDRPSYVATLRRALAPGGRLVNIDFIPKSREERGFGPPEHMQLPRTTVDAEMATAGLGPDVIHAFLPEQYFVEYRVVDE